jgi:hypothetical protein
MGLAHLRREKKAVIQMKPFTNQYKYMLHSSFESQDGSWIVLIHIHVFFGCDPVVVHEDKMMSSHSEISLLLSLPNKILLLRSRRKQAHATCSM